MTTKVVDSTVSQLLQDNSAVEYVDPKENPIAMIPRDDASVQDVEDPRSLELIFGQKHNEIDCALCPTAKRACNRAWVTAKQIENWSKMSTMTLSRRLHELEDCERITSLSDLVKTYIPDSLGVLHETTLYNLNVLNQLAMVEMKNKVLNETAKKFSDILSEVETTGSYGVAQPEMSDEEIMSRALEIAHRTLALREERIKALTKEQYEYLKNPSNCDDNECLDFDCLDDADHAETALENVFDVLEECELPAPDEEVDIRELREGIVNELLDRCAPLSARDGVRVIERLSVMLRHLPD